MDYMESNQIAERQLERFVLSVYTIYVIGMFVGTINNNLENWIQVILVGSLLICIYLHVKTFHSYPVRAIIYTCMMMVGVSAYITQLPTLDEGITLFLAVSIICALQGVTEIVYITSGVAAFLIFYHGCIIHTIEWSPDKLGQLAGIGNVVCIQYVVYMWVKKRNESGFAFLRIIDVLQKAQRSKDDFMANISHEIRTPINTICGMSEMAISEQDPAKLREEILDIQTAGNNLLSVISDVLDFSELQSDKVELQEETYNISSTLNDVINMTLAKKSRKNIELIVDCEAGIPCSLIGDEQKIRRVITNLLDNAIKFTNEGCVTLKMGCRKEAYGINLLIEIKDTGIGMNAESLEKLFTSFNQVDTRRNRQEGGIGLGLAISDAIIRKMGGFITVRSKLGKGSVVKVVIPQKIASEEPIADVTNRETINAATYINMEQFAMVAIRDEYSAMLEHTISQLQTKCKVCRNLAELKRRDRLEQFTHVFISFYEYQEDQSYFDELANRTRLVVILERHQESELTNAKILRLCKPFYILPIATILNGKYVGNCGTQLKNSGKLMAPDAHVLVVDDNQMNIRVIDGLLKQYGIKVTTALSGQEALDKIETKDYDFVFMDHMMPEMDGVETFKRIRKKPGIYYQNVPVVALTANAIAGSREMFMEEGFADFLAKPVEISVLERMLKRVLPREKQIFTDITVKEDTSSDNMEKNQETSTALAGEETAQADGGHDHGQLDQDAQNNHIQSNNHQSNDNGGEEIFAIGDLDVEKGCGYCGGRETYLQILAGCYGDKLVIKWEIEKLYQEENWKDYTIKVHALKSSMLSIGAVKLSELAKGLEFAGKKDDISYIHDHHQEMLKEYDRVMDILTESPLIDHPALVYPEGWQAEGLENQKTEENHQELKEISDEEFARASEAMEDAAYELNGEKMTEEINKLEEYSYHGKPLKEELSRVRHKIEMSDYMSAASMVAAIGKKLAENGGKSEE